MMYIIDVMSKLLILVTLLLFIVGCGLQGGSGSQIARINPVDTIYTLKDIKNAGFKNLKKYKIEELPGAIDAYYGFYDEKDYEVRFYQSHSDAVNLGLPIAEERVGSTPEDVKIRKEDATWKEGLKEARLCTGATTGSTSKGGTVIGAGGMGGFCIFPKYKDLTVFGNFILLCQGYDESEATKNCKKLLERLENN